MYAKMMLVFQLTIISFLKEYYTEENGCNKACIKRIKGKKKKKGIKGNMATFSSNFALMNPSVYTKCLITPYLNCV